jgi:hypothetical protein
MNHARIRISGFDIPLIGIPAEDVLIECELCHDGHDVFQMRVTAESKCYCNRWLEVFPCAGCNPVVNVTCSVAQPGSA